MALETSEVYRTETSAERKARRAYSGLFDHRPVEMRPLDGDRVACGGCESENEADAKFCIACGRPRRAELEVEMKPLSDTRVTCGGCGAENELDARFCIGCGRPRKASPKEAPRVAEGTA